MIGLDTNVLVRYFVQDDEAQALIATNLIEGLTVESPGFVNLVTLVELVWVLQRCYKVQRTVVVEVLSTLLSSKEIIVHDAEVAWKALRLYRDTQADFADGLILKTNSEAGCDYTVTFDRGAAKNCGMQLLEP